jgi:hypothetical protein
VVRVDVLLPLPEGVALYEHVGGIGGGGEGGGDGGAEGGWQWPSHSTMYSTYTKLPSYASSLTAGVAVVTKVYVPSGLAGNATIFAHSNDPIVVIVVIVVVVVVVVEVEVVVVADEEVVADVTAPSVGLHLPCTSTPLAVVLITYSSASS